MAMIYASGILENVIANEKDVQKERQPPKPNGGVWAWSVVAASFAISFIQDGIINSMGIIIDDLNHKYPSIGLTTISFGLSSCLAGVTGLTGNLASSFSEVYGCRVTAVSGMLIAAIGLLFAATARSTWRLIVGIGLITGFGFGLTYTPQNAIVIYYFSSKTKWANAIATAGSGVGEMALGPLFESITEAHSWRHTVTAMALMSILGAATCVTFRPVYGVEHAFRPVQSASEIVHRQLHYSRWDKFCRALRGSFTVGDLFSDKSFLVLGFGAFLTSVGFYAPIHLIVDFGREYAGLEPGQGGELYIAHGIAGLIGRILAGPILCDRFPEYTFGIFTWIIFMNGIVIMLAEYCTSLGILLVYFSALGLFQGGLVSLLAPAQLFLFGDEKFTKIFGLQSVFEAVGTFIGSPAVAYIKDATGSYVWAHRFAAMTFIVTAFIYLAIPYIKTPHAIEAGLPKGVSIIEAAAAGPLLETSSSGLRRRTGPGGGSGGGSGLQSEISGSNSTSTKSNEQTLDATRRRGNKSLSIVKPS